MSWSGYTQRLCKNGHLLSSTAYLDEAEPCLICGAGQVWWNQVDLTNGSFDGDKRIDGYIELERAEEPKEACICPICNNKHMFLPPVYKIPDKGGHKC